MGRSQVAYNRRHGRPGGGGGGGRGRGGRGGRAAPAASGRTKNAPSRSRGGGGAASDLGSNAWRYERKRDEIGDDDNEGEDDGEWDDAGAQQRHYYGEYGAAAHDVASTSGMMGEDMMTSDYGGGGGGIADNNIIDLAALSKSLSRLPVRERLRLPPHVAEHWEERYGKGASGGAIETRKTVSELRVMDPMDVDPAGGESPPSVEEHAEDGSEGNVGSTGEGESKAEVGSTQEDGVSDGDVDGEEEDLDAWLDSVI